MYRKKRKYFFTLIELLVSLSLAVILLTTLSFFYQKVNETNKRIEQQQKENFVLRYAENRLFDLFANTLSEKDSKKQFLFHTRSDNSGLINSTSLLFVYESNTDLTGALADKTLVRLFLDNQKRFCLMKWPIPEEWSRTGLPPSQGYLEVLLEDVEGLEFEFFNPPEQSWSTFKGEVNSIVNLRAGWEKEWRQEYQFLPVMVKIHLFKNQGSELKKHTLVFPLALSRKIYIFDH